MRILQICHRIPYPPVDGGNIAMMNMAIALTEAGHEVHQFALNTSKHYVDPQNIPGELRKKLHFHSVNINTKVRGTGVVRNLFTKESYNIVRFFSPEVEKELEKILREHSFDIVQLETLFTTPYINCIRKNSAAKIVLRAHNVEHIIWERMAKKETRLLRKRYLSLLASRLKKYETDTLRDLDALVPITLVDQSVFLKDGFHRPMITLPMSLDIKEYQFDKNDQPEMSLYHLGSMDWMPNRDGIEWFLGQCWPQLNKNFPELKLYLAGRNFPEEIKQAKHPNVICDGKIDDALAYARNKQIMIVPLHSGSGMRVKIIQGMALGKTIVSTTIGAEGIPVENEKNILIADSPADFERIIKRCLENPEWCRQIGMNGRKFVEQHYSNAAVGHQLGLFYQALKKVG